MTRTALTMLQAHRRAVEIGIINAAYEGQPTGALYEHLAGIELEITEQQNKLMAEQLGLIQ